MNDLKILSWNVRGCRNFDKRLSAFRILKQKNPSICMLQECHVLESELKEWESNWGVGKVFLNPGSNRSAGQAFLLSSNYDIIEHQIIEKGRLHLLKFRTLDTVITLINVYAPNIDSDRVICFNKMVELLSTYDFGNRVILGGDFNVVLQRQGKSGGQYCSSKSQQLLGNILESYRLIDIWRLKNKTVRKYTWSQKKPAIKCRLDFFLIQQNQEQSVISCKIYPPLLSDHSIIELKVNLLEFVRGRVCFKMNSSILTEKTFRTEIINLINDTWADNNLNVIDKYEWLKFKIMRHTIRYCKERSKKTKSKEKELNIELEKIDGKICNDTASKEDLERYQQLKFELENIIEERAKGAWVRSRIEYIEKNEKSNSYFFNKSKESFEKKTIDKINTDDDVTITEPKQILDRLRDFYKTL